MKKNAKHHFAHQDPEKIEIYAPDNTTSNKETQTIKKTPQGFLFRDLKKTTITIGIFIALLIVIFLIQNYTGLMKPVLKLFGL